MSVVYRQDVIDVIKAMKDLVHELGMKASPEIAMHIAQAVEDGAMAAYRSGYLEGQKNARN